MYLRCCRVFLVCLAVTLGCGGKDGPTKPPPPGNGGGEEQQILFTSSRDGNNEIYSIRPDGTGLTRLTNDSRRDEQADLSPNGTRIVFVHEESPSNTGDLYVMNADGTGKTRLTNTTAWETSPRWSPDGSRIAFCRGASFAGPPGLYSMRFDGTDIQVVLDSLEIEEADWSDDGEGFVFIIIDFDDAAAVAGLWSVSAEGSQLTHLTTGQDRHPNLSPDGIRIAFVRFDGMTSDVYVMDADGTDVTRLTTAGDGSPVWSPDGSQIAFSSGRDGSIAVWTMNSDGSNPTRLSSPPGADNPTSWR